MRKLLLIQAILITIILPNSFSQNEQQINYDIRDFFILDYTNYNNVQGIWIRPDSLKYHPKYKEFGAKMYNFLEYLLEHYSEFDYEYKQYLDSLLPDKKIIEKKFEDTLVNDTLLSSLFSNTIMRKKMGSVSIDTVQKIISRFFYLFRYSDGDNKGKLTWRICIGINEVLELPQNEKSPYINAFCWTIVRTNEKLMDYFFNEMIMHNQLSEDISDEKLNEINHINYAKTIGSEEVREIIISEYERLKEYLNFELVY